MAQGKLKVKSKVPENSKKKQNKKGNSCTERTNKPIKPKKTAFEENHKIKKMITKSVNKAAEAEIRNMAAGGSHSISKVQEAIAKHSRKGSGKK